MTELYLDGRLFSGTEEEFFDIKDFDCKSWYQNGVPHRDDGPALMWKDGRKMWYKNGLLHRKHGPAVICGHGVEWWENGKRYSCAHANRDDGLVLKCYKNAIKKINPQILCLAVGFIIILSSQALFVFCTTPQNKNTHQNGMTWVEVQNRDNLRRRQIMQSSVQERPRQAQERTAQKTIPPQPTPSQPRTTITNHNVENQYIIIANEQILRNIGISEEDIQRILTQSESTMQQSFE